MAGEMDDLIGVAKTLVENSARRFSPEQGWEPALLVTSSSGERHLVPLGAVDTDEEKALLVRTIAPGVVRSLGARCLLFLVNAWVVRRVVAPDAPPPLIRPGMDPDRVENVLLYGYDPDRMVCWAGDVRRSPDGPPEVVAWRNHSVVRGLFADIWKAFG